MAYEIFLSIILTIYNLELFRLGYQNNLQIQNTMISDIKQIDYYEVSR